MSDTDTTFDEQQMADAEAEERARQSQIVQSMREAGQNTIEPLVEDYFGFAEDHKVLLPDGHSYVIHSTLNEGARRAYLNNQNRDITVEKVTGNAKVKVMQGEERFALLTAAITGWSLQTANKVGDLVPVPFSTSKLRDFLEKAPPRIIDIIEKDVRKKNPWLLANATSEDIRDQIKDLEEMLEQKLEEEQGKGS